MDVETGRLTSMEFKRSTTPQKHTVYDWKLKISQKKKDIIFKAPIFSGLNEEERCKFQRGSRLYTSKQTFDIFLYIHQRYGYTLQAFFTKRKGLLGSTIVHMPRSGITHKETQSKKTRL